MPEPHIFWNSYGMKLKTSSMDSLIHKKSTENEIKRRIEIYDVNLTIYYQVELY